MNCIKYTFIFIILIIISSFCSPKLQSQDHIYFRDTNIQRADIYNFVIYSDFKNIKDGDNIDLILSYDTRIIFIRGLITGNGYWVDQPSVNPDTNLTRLDSAIIKISAKNVKVINNNIFCILQIEGLASSDSICRIVPRQLIINEKTVTDAKLDTGIIKVLGPSIYPNNPDNLGNGYPSPFPTTITSTIKFPFSIQKPSKLTFAIYTCDGRQIISTSDNDGMFEIYKNITNKINLTENPYDAGSYELHFNPDITKIASGLYFLIMKTDRGVYNTNFIYHK